MINTSALPIGEAVLTEPQPQEEQQLDSQLQLQALPGQAQGPVHSSMQPLMQQQFQKPFDPSSTDDHTVKPAKRARMSTGQQQLGVQEESDIFSHSYTQQHQQLASQVR